MSRVNTRISASCSNVAMSADARYVVYVQGTIYLWDRMTGVTQLVPHRAGAATTPGNGVSIAPALSANGRFVAYRSYATDLVPGGTIGDQVFLFDRETGESVLVSGKAGAVGVGGDASSRMATIAADGSHVAYVSAATDLVAGQVDQPGSIDIFLYERATGINRLVSHAWDSPVTSVGGGFPPQFIDRPFLSDDGRYTAFISLGALVNGQTTLGNPNVFLYDRTADANTLVSHASNSATAGIGVGAYTGSNTSGGLAGLSADGGKVLFLSSATGVVPGQTSGSPTPQLNAFLFDRSSSTNTLASAAAASSIRTGNGASDAGWLADEGGTAVFVSAATDLVPDDLNQATDVFLHLPHFPVPSGSMSFHTLSPCRLVDTRVPAAEWGAPAVYGGDDRSFTAAGRCGIPSSARAVSLNVTVTQPTASGDLRLFSGGAAPLASSINYGAGQTRANNAVVFLGPGGTFSLRSDQPTGAAQVILDVNGYFE
jgi:Tol biopolymer transport system component